MTLAWIIAALFWSQRIAGRDWMRADWSFFCLCVSVQIACFLCSWRSSVECNCRLAQLTWIMARMGQEEGKALHAAERNPCCRTEARGLSFGGGGENVCVCGCLHFKGRAVLSLDGLLCERLAAMLLL